MSSDLQAAQFYATEICKGYMMSMSAVFPDLFHAVQALGDMMLVPIIVPYEAVALNLVPMEYLRVEAPAYGLA